MRGRAVKRVLLSGVVLVTATGCLVDFPAAAPDDDAAVARLDRGLDGRDGTLPPTDALPPSDAGPAADRGVPRDAAPARDGGAPTDGGPDVFIDPGCMPRPEVCDGLDQDCDGRVDEDYNVGAACAAGQGACRVDGRVVCDGPSRGACSARPGVAVAENCNGEDDDCDGRTDEDFDLGGACSVGVGACLRRGGFVCDARGLTRCGVEAGEPVPEACNGVNDDCDGETDEAFPLGQPCTEGLGRCRTEGRWICNEATGGAKCDRQIPSPRAEVCDGVDQDCDGRADEDFQVGEPCQKQVGACVTQGVFACQNTQAICTAPEPDGDGDGFGCDTDCDDTNPSASPAGVEVCGDGVDNDCSGAADDIADCDCVERYRGDHRYLVCPRGRPWFDARAWCAAYGADLIVVGSAAEGDWAIERAQQIDDKSYWIGLTDLADEGTFVWVDGSPLGYRNWDHNEPNDFGVGAGTENCVHYNTERSPDWNDEGCGSALGALCEDRCEAGTDADGDGVPGCGEDCDDGNPAIGAQCP